jgi:AAA family ATP:ADP antiporter
VALSRALALVRPDERRGAVAAFATIFGTLAAHTLLETARDALFLARLPASRLAVVYLVIAAVAVAIAQVPWGRRRAGGAYALCRLLGGGAVVTFLFWALGRWRSPLELYALYVWTGLLGSLAVLQFWMVLSDLYTLTQAKRLYSLVWTGSLLGASAGALFARFLAERTSAASLVLASAVVFALTAALPAVALGRAAGRAEGEGSVRPRPTFAEASRLFRGQPYVRSLAVLVLVSTVALTLGDYVFKSAVARAVPEARLGAFFGGVYTVLNLLALLAQVALGSWLFRAVGLHRALWVLPALVFVGAAGVALGGGLVAALLLKGADGSLRNSVHRTGTELLYVPLPDTVRSQAKPIIDLVGQRGGQALASLLILAETFLSRGDVVLAGASAGVSLVWIAWVADLKELYLDVFRSALREGTLRPAADLPPVDLVSLETLFAGLNSADDNEVLAAMDLLQEEGRAGLVPALILYHPSSRVVLRALEILVAVGRTDFLPVADRLLSHPDPEIRAGALRARTSVAPDEGRLRAAVADPDPLVRATAVALLVGGGWAGQEAAAWLEPLVSPPEGEAAIALARAIADRPSPVFSDALLRLADSPSSDVQVEVARAMGHLRRPEFLLPLLTMLGPGEVRGEARRALLAYGDEGLAFLDQALADRDLPIELRRHLPRTVSLFPPTAAADVLARHLLEEPSGVVRYRLLRGMNRLAAASGVAFDPVRLRSAIDRTIEAIFRLVHWQWVLDEGARADARRARPGHELLGQLLRDKEAQALERLFRLLALQDRGEDFKRIYRGLRADGARARASSRELLENVLAPPLRAAVLAIVDEGGGFGRLVGAPGFYEVRSLDYEGLLALMLERGGESLRSIAAFHVGELSLAGFRTRLETMHREGASFFLARVLERALDALPAEGGSGA